MHAPGAHAASPARLIVEKGAIHEIWVPARGYGPAAEEPADGRIRQRAVAVAEPAVEAPDRCTANRPRSAAVKYTYGPRIRASFDQCYGLVRNTEQRKAAIDSKITAESAPNISDVYGIEATSPPDRLASDCRSVPEMSSATDRTPPSPDSTCNTPPGNRDRGLSEVSSGEAPTPAPRLV